MDKVASATKPLPPGLREFLDLESSIHDTRNAAKVVNLIVELLLEQGHPLSSAYINDCRAYLWQRDDVEALLHAVYHLNDLSKRMAESFAEACNGVNWGKGPNQICADSEGALPIL